MVVIQDINSTDNGAVSLVKIEENFSNLNSGKEEANPNIQAHISSTSNPHVVTKSQVGLWNVDNTNDASKPVSTATQTALDWKASLTGTETLTNKTITLPVFTNGAINFNAPEGFLINWKIVPSVASNNLTVAIKTLAGTDPSSANPVYIRIWDVVRSITSTLSKTVLAWSFSWFNMGSTELATKEVDLFTYISWNWTNIGIWFSRIPYGNIASDFNLTNVDNEKYIQSSTSISWNNQVVNIGRFAATLSAGAGYTWSIPTFTASNLIQRPIYETRWISSNANRVWFSTSWSTVNYKIIWSHISHIFDIWWTSNATNFSFTLPFSPTIIWPDFPQGLTQDNWTNKTSPGRCTVSSNTVTCYSDLSSGWWTASGNKLIRGQFIAII